MGVYLGGTNTAFAIVDSVGHIVANDSIPTRTPTVEKWADNLASKISRMIADNILEGMIEGIGIGAPCANASTGCIEGATNLPWPSPIALVNMISNDANAAAIGEMTYGAAAGLRNFIVLTLGTSVGGGIVCDGHLLSGRSGFAGELGHVTFPFASDRLCSCGRYGCLHTIGSADGIRKTARRMLAESDEPSVLRDIPQGEMTPKKVQIAACDGDRLANRIYEFTGHCLGKAAAEFAAVTDPEAFILFGGVSKAGDLLLKPMREAFLESALFLYKDRVRFLLSKLHDADAAILGAASLPLSMS